MGGLAADAGVDLVEDQRLAAADGCDCKCDAGELTARGGFGRRRKRQAGVGANEERHLVVPRRGRLALAQLNPELAFAQADAAKLLGDGGRERLGGTLAGCPQLSRQRANPRFRFGKSPGRSRQGVGSSIHRLELGACLGCPSQELLVARAAKTALCGGDALELRLHLVEPVGLG